LGYPFVIARLVPSEARELAEAISWRGRRLPRTFQVLAMTKNEVPDESGNYKNLEVKYEDNS